MTRGFNTMKRKNPMRKIAANLVIVAISIVRPCTTNGASPNVPGQVVTERTFNVQETASGGTRNLVGVTGTLNSERQGLRLSVFVEGMRGALGFDGFAKPQSRYHETPPIKEDPKPVPPEYAARMTKGIDLEKEGKYAEAESSYRSIIAELPNTPAPFARLAFTLQALGCGREACEMFRKFQSLGGRYRTQFVPEEVNALLVVDPPDNEQSVIGSGKRSSGLVSSDGEVWIVHLRRSDEVMISTKECWLGEGSSVEFDTKDWVPFLGKRYRKGGVSVKRYYIEFHDNTERLEDDGRVTCYLYHRWRDPKEDKKGKEDFEEFMRETFPSEGKKP
jgi:hypothetical protein